MRDDAIEELYRSLATLMRRRAQISNETHPDLSLPAYSMLTEIGADDGVRASDLSSLFGLDKSTVSRQLDNLEQAGLINRCGERPGRRGNCLALTTEGRASLDAAAERTRALLAERLAGWTEPELGAFAELIERFLGEFG